MLYFKTPVFLTDLAIHLATLGVLGMEDVIGNFDNQSAERVYEAIMGGEYR